MAASSLTWLVIAVATVQVAFATYAYYPPCDPPHSLDYGEYGPVKDEYPVGSKIEYRCNDGYVLYGKSWTVCKYYNRKSSWTHKAPICKPIKCPDLDDIRYGGVKVTGNKVGAKATYYCNKGYKLVGDSYRVCLKTAYWGGMEPVCKPVKCGDLDKIPYGSVRVSAYTYGSKAHFSCDKGYKLYGEPWRQCQYDGKWGGDYPVCKPVKCGKLDKIPYGSIRISAYTYGSKAHFSCDKGYKLYGEPWRACQHDGQWGGKYPVCKPIRCPDLDIEYGKVKVTGYTPGSKAIYYCNPYHKLVGDATRKCLYDGTWSDEEPICKKILCPTVDPIQYGKINVTGYHPTSKVYYKCDDGYELRGLVWRKCLPSGVWYGKAPVCHKKIVCPHIDPPEYGTIKVSGYYPHSKATYSCNDGYTLYGLSWRKCLPTGVWYGKAPVCKKRIVCPHPVVPDYGSVKVTGYTPSSIASYSCDYGYKLYGLQYRKCLSDGSWYGTDPTCHPVKY